MLVEGGARRSDPLGGTGAYHPWGNLTPRRDLFPHQRQRYKPALLDVLELVGDRETRPHALMCMAGLITIEHVASGFRLTARCPEFPGFNSETVTELALATYLSTCASFQSHRPTLGSHMHEGNEPQWPDERVERVAARCESPFPSELSASDEVEMCGTEADRAPLPKGASAFSQTRLKQPFRLQEPTPSHRSWRGQKEDGQWLALSNLRAHAETIRRMASAASNQGIMRACLMALLSSGRAPPTMLSKRQRLPR